MVLTIVFINTLYVAIDCNIVMCDEIYLYFTCSQKRIVQILSYRKQ